MIASYTHETTATTIYRIFPPRSKDCSFQFNKIKFPYLELLLCQAPLHYFKNINPFSPHHKPVKEALLSSPVYRGQHWGRERWNEMPELAQLVSAGTHGLASRSCALHLSALLPPIHSFISFRNCLPQARCWGRNGQCRDKSFYLQKARRLGEESNTSISNSLACCSGCGTDLRGTQGKANLLLTECL